MNELIANIKKSNIKSIEIYLQFELLNLVQSSIFTIKF